MNAHALAATTTREPDEATREAWIAHCVAIQMTWRAIDQAVREEVDR